MPNWKKLIVSGSDASLNSLNVATSITASVVSSSFTGSLFGTSSWAVTASHAVTSSYGLNPRISGSLNNADAVIFNTAASVPISASVLTWDSGEGTLQLGLAGGNVDLTVGEQLYQYVYNAQGTTLTKGQVVYSSGSQGGRIAVKLASATAEFGSANTLGLVAETILAGAEGWVITEGSLKGLNTSGLTSSPFVYLSSSAGQYTSTSPQAPLHNVRLGVVQKIDAATGAIYVKIDNGYESDELHDIILISGSNGDLLVRSGSYWINTKQLTGSYELTGSLSVSSSGVGLTVYGNQEIWANAATLQISNKPDGGSIWGGPAIILADYQYASKTQGANLGSIYFSDDNGNTLGSLIAQKGTNSGKLDLNLTYNTSGNSALYVDGDLQNVGIRNVSPSYSLDVSGSGNYSGGLTVTGSINVSGSSHIVTGSFRATSFTGSLFGTASWASNFLTSSVTSASLAATASYVNSALTASYFITSSVTSASYAATASYVETARTASYFITSSVTSASYAVTASHAISAPLYLPLAGGTITGNLVVNNNLTVYGTASFVFVTASQLDVSASFISVNVFEPTQRFGGLKVYDSGSSNATASLAWDSLKNYWIYQNASGSTYSGGMLISGPRNTGSLGQEQGLTNTRVPVAQGGDHIQDSDIVNVTGSYVSLEVNTRITGSLNVSSGVTASLFGTSSWTSNFTTSSVTSASFASTASYFVTSSVTSASYAVTASYVLGAVTSTTFPYTGSAIISGSLSVTGSASISGSLSIYGSGSAVLTISGSQGGILQITDSSATSDLFAVASGGLDLFKITNDKTFSFSGSLVVTGSITGSLFGTSSWSSNSITASLVTGSIFESGNLALSSSYAVTASYVLGAVASTTFPYTGSAIISGSLEITGSIRSSDLINGSILFATASGQITQSNANLFWDTRTRRLGVGTNIPASGSGVLTANQTQPIIHVNTNYTGSVTASIINNTTTHYLFTHTGSSSGLTIAVGNTAGGNRGMLNFYKNWTTNFNTPTTGSAVNVGDRLGVIRFVTADGTGASSVSSQIEATVDSTADVTKVLSRVGIFVGGGGASLEALKVYSSGNTALGSSISSDNGNTLQVAGRTGLNGDTSVTGSLIVTVGAAISGNFSVSSSTATVSGSLTVTGSLNATRITSSLFGTASWASNVTTALTASSLNSLNQGSVIITGSLFISGSNSSLLIGGNVTSSTEASLIIGVPPNVGTGEGGQIILQASNISGYTSASMLDNYQNQFRILRGNNTSSDAAHFVMNMHNGQSNFYTSLAIGNITPSSTTGRLDAANDVVAFSTSDERFKANVSPITNALDKIKSVSGVEFDWIPNEEHHGFTGHDVGVIAQELERVLPEVVTTRPSGYKAVKYEKIVALLIQAIKEQQEEIEELKRKIK